MTQKCTVINAKLIVPMCPLAKGDCMWQHRKTKMCKYRSEFDSNPPSAEHIADLVGERVPSQSAVQRIADRIKDKFKQLT